MRTRIASTLIALALIGCDSASGVVGPAGLTREPLAKGSAPSVRMDLSGPVEVTHLLVTWDSDGTTGWIEWPGPLLATMKSGELAYRTPGENDCGVQTFKVGDSHLIPAGTVHQAFNLGSGPAQMHIVAFVPPGAGPVQKEKPEGC
ncbi:MAG: hypothetical protein ACT4QG_08510 [Sporichthyaceae bacterium]